MKQQCIIKQVPITRQGELRVFQIKIPRTAERIIGIETGIIGMKYNDQELARREDAVAQQAQAAAPTIKVPIILPAPNPGFQSLFSSTFTFRPDLLIGELKLQSLERANIFYVTDVYEASLNMMYGDFSIVQGFIPQPWTHGRNRFEDVVMVNGETTILNGLFKDRLGEGIKRDWPYKVNVYVWYEIKEEHHDHKPCS
jgi:hypothetical protein